MKAVVRLRDVFKRVTPWFLQDRPESNKSVGYRYLWVVPATLDAYVHVLIQGMRAAWPGAGTPTALPAIGRTRGIIRGQNDTDDTFAAKLRGWLDMWAIAGSMEAIGLAIHDYLGNAPRVRIVNRNGVFVTIGTDRSVTFENATWDWDSVSNPERAGYWSELWVIVYPTQWSASYSYNDGRKLGEADRGIGHSVTRNEVNAVVGLIRQWKAAHSKIRTVIFTSDGSLFDPNTPASLPDGTWGQWGTRGSGARVASGRNTTSCRYWEPA